MRRGVGVGRRATFDGGAGNRKRKVLFEANGGATALGGGVTHGRRLSSQQQFLHEAD